MLIQTDTIVNSFNFNSLINNSIGGTSFPARYLCDDFRLYSSVLQQSDISALTLLYSNPGVIIPVLHYSFDQWTSGTTVINEGSYINMDGMLQTVCSGHT